MSAFIFYFNHSEIPLNYITQSVSQGQIEIISKNVTLAESLVDSKTQNKKNRDTESAPLFLF